LCNCKNKICTHFAFSGTLTPQPSFAKENLLENMIIVSEKVYKYDLVIFDEQMLFEGLEKMVTFLYNQSPGKVYCIWKKWGK
jgi:hypothetical protein